MSVIATRGRPASGELDTETGKGPDESPAPRSEQDREKRAEYLAFAAHEVRNPLSTALWSAELLVRVAPPERGGPRGEKLAAMCLRALHRLQQLVEDHLLIERLESGGLPMHREPLGLREVLTAAIDRRPLDSGACEVEDLPPLSVAADRSLLERSLGALLHAAGRGGVPIRISGSQEGGWVALLVRGAQPSEAALADPVRGSESEPQGHSLSLAVAKRVAKVLDGELQIGEGGYLLRLPVYDAARAPAGG